MFFFRILFLDFGKMNNFPRIFSSFVFIFGGNLI
jgi:hypothetical protein